MWWPGRRTDGHASAMRINHQTGAPMRDEQYKRPEWMQVDDRLPELPDDGAAPTGPDPVPLDDTQIAALVAYEQAGADLAAIPYGGQ